MYVRALFRCDASIDIGIGHAMRCLAFAETLNAAGWSCTFATNREAPEVAPALLASGFDRVDTNDEDYSAGGFSLAIVDHYRIDAAFERGLREQGTQVIVFDDLADRSHACAILVDPTPDRVPADYRSKVLQDCQLMLGPKYAIIRVPWIKRRHSVRNRLAAGRPVARIFVSMGGTDPHGATRRVVDALAAAVPDVHVDILLGAGAPDRAQLAQLTGSTVSLHVDHPDPAALASEADLAIGAAGTSSFERAVLGLPAILVPLADNQRAIAASFAAADAAEVVSASTLDDPAAFGARITALTGDGPRRAAMSQRAAALTDGRGSLRLLAAIAGRAITKFGRRVHLRLAEATDEAWLLELQRQEATRRFARNPAIPSAAEHAAWFSEVLDDIDRLLMIVEFDNCPAGMVRLDRLPDLSFEISIAVDSRRHGEGIAEAALVLVRRLAPGADLIATIKPENWPSLSLFAAAGYRADGVDRYRNIAR